LVIHAFNENYPYDKFVNWQLAGELLPEPTKEQLLAQDSTEITRLRRREELSMKKYRIEYVTDRNKYIWKGISCVDF
jgi:hypothetical protein